jgi:peptide/nickel transport system substrate-binding protein
LVAACGSPAPTAAPAAPTTAPPAAATTAPPATSATLAKPAQSAAGAPKGQVVVAQGGQIISLDATMETGMLTFNPASHVFDTLLTREEMELKPLLASAWKFVDDRTIRLTIRDGVKFHNGDPLSVNDVKFTMDRVSADGTKSRHFTYTKIINETKIIDDHTVDIVLKQPDASFLGRLTLIPILPQKVVQQAGDEAFAERPIGSGPYKFVEWLKGQRVVVEANPDYWRGAPKIKTIVFRTIAEDNTRMAELRTGGVDIAVNMPPALRKDIESSGKVSIMPVRSLRTLFILLNSLKPPFQDARVRKAVNHAVDVKLICETVIDGACEPVTGPFGPGVFGYNPNIQPYDYNPNKAKKLLQEAGFAGAKVEFYGFAGRLLKDRELMEAIAGQLEQVGIKVNLHVMEFQGFFDNFVLKKNMDMDMGLWSNANNTADADYNLTLNVHSKQRGIYWNDPAIDAAIDQARTTTDPEQRRAQYQDLLSRFVDAAPWLFLYDQVDMYGVSKRVQSWKPRPDEWIYLYQAAVTE